MHGRQGVVNAWKRARGGRGSTPGHGFRIAIMASKPTPSLLQPKTWTRGATAINWSKGETNDGGSSSSCGDNDLEDLSSFVLSGYRDRDYPFLQRNGPELNTAMGGNPIMFVWRTKTRSCTGFERDWNTWGMRESSSMTNRNAIVHSPQKHQSLDDGHDTDYFEDGEEEDDLEFDLSKEEESGKELHRLDLQRIKRLKHRRQDTMMFRSLAEFMRAKRAVVNSNYRFAMQAHGYRVIRPLGRGNFGKVFLTLQESRKQLRAIKILDLSTARREYNWTWLTAEEREQAQRDSNTIWRSIMSLPPGVVRDHMNRAHGLMIDKLRREEDPQKRRTRRPVAEREILMRCGPHPFISNLITSFRDHSHMFLVFAYYPAGTLHMLLDECGGKFDAETARFYAAELGLALEFLQKNNIAHRDVKPQNILLTQNGHLAVTDFGLATRLVGGLKTFCGTAEYIAPEVLSEKSWKSSYLDWWAFGITLYQMLTGKTPFGGKSAATVFLNTLTAPLTFPEGFPEDAKDLLTRVLSRDYSERIGPQDILKHRYFASIDLEKLLRKELDPPLKPRVRTQVEDEKRARPRVEFSFESRNKVS